MGKSQIRPLTNLFIGCVALLMAATPLAALSQEAEESAVSAHQRADEVKDELVTVIRNKSELEAEGGEEKYFDAVQAVLDPVVDFRYIARGVMGKHAADATSEQRQRFAGTFKRSLITTYAKGLAAYGDYDIEVVPPKGDVSGKKSLSVVMQVSGEGTTNVLAFSMRLNREEEWKLVNMVLNGINLGKTFRNQFDQSMRKSGDMDEVIDNWGI